MLAIFNLGGGEIVLLSMLLLFPLAIAAFVFWIWMLVHAIQNPALGQGEKVAWVLVILFLHFLGALIYLIAGRRQKVRSTASL
jgi:hypothetical protein